jgi:hypothetical protein
MRPIPLASGSRVQAPGALGPYVVSGGWWGGGVRRDYYFAPADGNLQWMYYDHRHKRLLLQGGVE